MPVSIDECKRLLEYRATKSGFNGNLSPAQFNLIWNRAQQRFFNQLYKSYGINQSNTDTLFRFKSDPISITVDNTGKYVKPSDLLHIDSITKTIGDEQYEITRVGNDRLASYLSSSYDAPTDKSPIYVEYSAYLQFYPIDITPVNLVYLKEPIDALWNYTLVSGRPVYDAGTSVQTQFDASDVDEIIALCGVDLGINMRDSLIIQTQDKLAKENQ